MTDKMLAILAAMFARSNMGMPRAEAHEISGLKHSKYDVSPQEAVCQLCQQYIEDEESEEAFTAEAMGWRKYLVENEETARTNHPDMFAIYDAA